MYRQGLGDCFLITFNPAAEGAPTDDERHMLIDCGTLGATTTGVKIKEVTDDIHKTTGGHLHLLIATHEHQDHVSGFRSQMKRFQQDFKIDRVWLAWTEDPADEDAKAVVKYREDLGRALTAVAQAAPTSDVALNLGDLLGFFREEGEPLGASDFAKTVNEAMHFVRTGTGTRAEYLSPGGAPLEPEWLPGFRIYVLGPPRASSRLGDLGGHGSEHLYGLGAGVSSLGLRAAATSLQAAAAAGAQPESVQIDVDSCELEMPFDRQFRKAPAEAWEWYDSYFARGSDWRSIDGDWLRLASDLALQLDSMTNNTSLALAIERIADEKVLLFPADAQQGNWLSWHDPAMKWNVPASRAGPARLVTAADLLRRTVFYKVGHHGSHNATARKLGLELMTNSDEVTAFIPVDRAVALSRNPKDSWQMPARPLYLRLLEQCQGRVVRSDLGWAKIATAAGPETEAEFRRMGSKSNWKLWEEGQAREEKSGRVRITPLFVDFTLL